MEKKQAPITNQQRGYFNVNTEALISNKKESPKKRCHLSNTHSPAVRPGGDSPLLCEDQGPVLMLQHTKVPSGYWIQWSWPFPGNSEVNKTTFGNKRKEAKETEAVP